MNKRRNAGLVTAAVMTSEERKERSRKGAIARMKNQGKEVALPESKYRGVLSLKGLDVECHVLSNGQRVLTYRQVIKMVTGSDSGGLAEYVGVDALKSLIDKDKVLAENVEFSVPGTGLKAKGLKAETFADICEAYVEANYKGLLTTARQKDIASRCAIILSAFAKVGLISLIDESTGFQNFRANDELRKKYELYITQKERPWIKTFQDEFYIQLGRLCGLKNWKNKQPHYAQITTKLYKLVDPDIQQKLKELDVNPNVHQHQYLKEYGVYELKRRIEQATGLALGCETIKEFNQKMKLFEPGGTYQLSFPFPQ